MNGPRFWHQINFKKEELKRKDILLLGVVQEKVYCRYVGKHSQRRGHLGVSRVDMRPSEEKEERKEEGREGSQVQQPGGPKEQKKKKLGNQNGWTIQGRAAERRATQLLGWRGLGQAMGYASHEGPLKRQGLRDAGRIWQPVSTLICQVGASAICSGLKSNMLPKSKRNIRQKQIQSNQHTPKMLLLDGSLCSQFQSLPCGRQPLWNWVPDVPQLVSSSQFYCLTRTQMPTPWHTICQNKHFQETGSQKNR